LYPISSKSGDTIKVTVTRKINSIAALDSLILIPQKYRIPILSYASYLTARTLHSPLTASFLRDYKEEVAILETRGSNVSTPKK
jgi:hypothetical protein